MDAEMIHQTLQYLTGFGAGCVAGYGFGLKQAKEKMTLHNEVLLIHKDQIKKLEDRIKQFEEVFYPNMYERRKNQDDDYPSAIDRRKRDD